MQYIPVVLLILAALSFYYYLAKPIETAYVLQHSLNVAVCALTLVYAVEWFNSPMQQYSILTSFYYAFFALSFCFVAFATGMRGFKNPFTFIAIIVLSFSMFLGSSYLKGDEVPSLEMNHYYMKIGTIFKGEKLTNGFVFEGDSLKYDEGEASNIYSIPKDRPFVFGDDTFLYDESTGQLDKYKVVDVEDSENIDLSRVKLIIDEKSFIME